MQTGALTIKLRPRSKKGALVGISKSHGNRDMAPECWAELPDTAHNYPSKTCPSPPPHGQPPRVASPPSTSSPVHEQPHGEPNSCSPTVPAGASHTNSELFVPEGSVWEIRAQYV